MITCELNNNYSKKDFQTKMTMAVRIFHIKLMTCMVGMCICPRLTALALPMFNVHV